MSVANREIDAPNSDVNSTARWYPCSTFCAQYDDRTSSIQPREALQQHEECPLLLQAR